jgi:monoamine oxidase
MTYPQDHTDLSTFRKWTSADTYVIVVTVFEASKFLNETYGNIFFRMKDAPRLLQERYQGIFTDTRYSEKTRLFAAWLKTIVDTISPGNLRSSLEADLHSHLMDELERLDLEPYFSENGETIDLNSFIQDNPGFRACCSKALDMFLSDIIVETSHTLLQLKGGMEQIIHRLVESINSPIQCNQPVVAMRVRENYTEIDYLENGQLQTRICDYVLNTIPFSVMRKMELSGFDARKLDSIHNTIYCPATKVAFHTKEAFWQQQGINGGASFSGAGVRQTYYPSVKFNPNHGSVMLASYTIGDDADVLGNMTEQQRHDYVKDVVGKVHPELLAEGMVSNVASIAWGNYEWSAGGCTVHWGNDTSDESNHTVNYLEAARPQNNISLLVTCSDFLLGCQGSMRSALEAFMTSFLMHSESVKLTLCSVGI